MRMPRPSDSLATFHDVVDHVWGALQAEADPTLTEIFEPAFKAWNATTGKRIDALRVRRRSFGGHQRLLFKLGRTLTSFSKLEEGHVSTDEGAAWKKLVASASDILKLSQEVRRKTLLELVGTFKRVTLPALLKATATKLEGSWESVASLEKSLDSAKDVATKSVASVNEAKQVVIDAMEVLSGELRKRYKGDEAAIESFFLALDSSGKPAEEEKKKDGADPKAGTGDSPAAGDAPKTPPPAT